MMFTINIERLHRADERRGMARDRLTYENKHRRTSLISIISQLIIQDPLRILHVCTRTRNNDLVINRPRRLAKRIQSSFQPFFYIFNFLLILTFSVRAHEIRNWPRCRAAYCIQ